MRSNVWKFAFLFLFVAGILEGLAFVAGKVLAAKGLLHTPRAPEDWGKYVADRDPRLGWPSPSAFGKGEYDASGSRVVPAFPDPATPACVSLFGDSYTFGDEVGPADAYGNVLAQALGCRVANYGVGGYGTDQALLRYELLKPASPTVVLGHFSENIVRNVNQQRGFLTNQDFGLKPRFIEKGDGLELVPLPSLDERQYRHIAREADRLLPHDYFRPGGDSGIVELRFPHLVSVARSFGHYRLQARLRGEPSYAQFYRPDHPSRALEVTARILERFVRVARERGQKPLVVLIPDVKDLEWLRQHGKLPEEPLVERLRQRDLPFVSAAADMHKHLAGKEPCSLYYRCSGSHFRPEGYRLLAGSVERALRAQGVATKASETPPPP